MSVSIIVSLVCVRVGTMYPCTYVKRGTATSTWLLIFPKHTHTHTNNDNDDVDSDKKKRREKMKKSSGAISVIKARYTLCSLLSLHVLSGAE